MMTRHLIIILGDQLNLDNPALEDFDRAQDHILMAEVGDEASYVWSHKARIALFLAAMRHFLAELQSQQFPVTYLRLGKHQFKSLGAVWLHYLQHLKPQKVIACEPGEYRIMQMLQQVCEKEKVPLILRDDSHFMCSQADFKRWAGPVSKVKGRQLRMEFFYRMMRKKFQVLMAADQPTGGKWNYDAENRKAFGKQGPPQSPPRPCFKADAITQEVFGEVEQHFADHPGSLTDFYWPVTRAQALVFLDDFIRHRLAAFGQYQDAMWQSAAHQAPAPFLWHALISSSLNLKLLNPREVIQAAQAAYAKKHLPLAGVEGFIRQILGWREFIRGVYWLDMPALAEANHYQHHRRLPAWYWTADTQMNCQRQAISQTLQYGYAHHIQRLMITGMFGLLAEVDPKEVAAWYLAVYVDAVEWVELPNVAGMALYADGGRFTSKPYIASGAYIKRMSNYCAHCQYRPQVKTGADACPVTTLYWHFVIKHETALANNPRTALMAKNASRFNADERAAINAQANSVLKNIDKI